jgi:hypothetical protein
VNNVRKSPAGTDIAAANRQPVRYKLLPLSPDRTQEENGGEGGIRTHGTLSRTAVFKTAALNHSATSPEQVRAMKRRGCPSRFLCRARKVKRPRTGGLHRCRLTCGRVARRMIATGSTFRDVPGRTPFRAGAGEAQRSRNIAEVRGRRSGVVGRVLNRRPKLEVGSSIAVTGRSSATPSPYVQRPAPNVTCITTRR